MTPDVRITAKLADSSGKIAQYFVEKYVKEVWVQEAGPFESFSQAVPAALHLSSWIKGTWVVATLSDPH